MRLSPRTVGVTLAAVAVAAFVGLLALGLLNKAPVTGRSGVTRVGKPAPEMRLPLLGGGELVLSQHREQPGVINFWVSWCPPCRAEAPLLERAWRAYKDRGVLFVGVGVQDTEQDGLAFLRDYGITYPSGLDRDGKITVDYGVIGLPVTFFVDREGVIQRRWVGAINEARLMAWVEDLAVGVAPSGELEGSNPEGFRQLKEGQQ